MPEVIKKKKEKKGKEKEKEKEKKKEKKSIISWIHILLNTWWNRFLPLLKIFHVEVLINHCYKWRKA